MTTVLNLAAGEGSEGGGQFTMPFRDNYFPKPTSRRTSGIGHPNDLRA
jgi:hypothetical protein